MDNEAYYIKLNTMCNRCKLLKYCKIRCTEYLVFQELIEDYCEREKEKCLKKQEKN